ncbi:unnamed protein product [Lampetra fluviatilis]
MRTLSRPPLRRVFLFSRGGERASLAEVATWLVARRGVLILIASRASEIRRKELQTWSGPPAMLDVALTWIPTRNSRRQILFSRLHGMERCLKAPRESTQIAARSDKFLDLRKTVAAPNSTASNNSSLPWRRTTRLNRNGGLQPCPNNKMVASCRVASVACVMVDSSPAPAMAAVDSAGGPSKAKSRSLCSSPLGNPSCGRPSPQTTQPATPAGEAPSRASPAAPQRASSRRSPVETKMPPLRRPFLVR